MEKQLNLIEIYRSIQGETSLAGLPTTFVRLAACNLRCSWCDTPYSFGRGTPMTLTRIHSIIQELGCDHICITGGEPLLQPNVHLLMKQLCDNHYTVSLETGGSLSIKPVDQRVIVILDVKCPGSGMSEKNDLSNLKILRKHDEVKFVLKDEKDYVFALDIAKKYHLLERDPAILLSPVHGVLNPQKLVEWILRDSINARLNLQIHKYIWTAETIGV